MSSTLERTESNVITPRSTFILRFISTIALWTIALLIMFSGYEILFWVLISLFGLIGLLEFYLMLDHQDCLSNATFEHGPINRAILCSVSDRSDKICRHGCVPNRQRRWTTPDGPSY